VFGEVYFDERRPILPSRRFLFAATGPMPESQGFFGRRFAGK
jgi:hypothetical protein